MNLFATIQDRRRIARLRAGDRAALEQLVADYEQPLYNLARRMLGRAEDAEDATQEAFLAIFRTLPSFEGRSSLETWMVKIMVNVCLQRRRKETARGLKMEMLDENAAVAPDADPLFHALARQEGDRLRAALETLPEAQRSVVVLHELHGLTYAEVAAALDCPVGTVKSRLSTAFGRLRRALEAEAAGAPFASGAERKTR